MSVSRRLDELKSECEQLGLKVIPEKKKEGKRDFVLALQQYNLKKQFPDGAPKALSFMLSMASPMLCFRLPEMPPEFQTSVWDNPDWYAETKVNGCRMLVIYNEQEGLKFFSRNLSLTDYLPVNYDNIWLDDLSVADFSKLGISSFILDTEVLCPQTKVDTTNKLAGGGAGVITETNLQATTALLSLNKADSLRIQKENDIHLEFHAFQLLELNGNDFQQLPYEKMILILDELIGRLESVGLNVKAVPRTNQNKKAFFEAIVAKGGEGVVLKIKTATYHPTESRYHKEWLKAKRTMSFGESSGGLGDTIDGFITGFQLGNKGTAFENLVGCFEVSVYLNKKDGTQAIHHIANVPNLTLALRKQVTKIVDGKPVMDPSYLNKVLELDGQWISARAKRLVHPRMVQFRPDRSPETCVMDEATIDRMVI